MTPDPAYRAVAEFRAWMSREPGGLGSLIPDSEESREWLCGFLLDTWWDGRDVDRWRDDGGR